MHRQRPALHSLVEAVAFEQLGHDIGLSVVHPDVVDRQDIRVIQRSRRARFLLEPTQSLGIAGEGGRQDLDRHVTPQTGIARSIHLAHPAGADERDNFVDAEPHAGNQRHREWKEMADYTSRITLQPSFDFA